MECSEAQAVISETLDGSAPDSATLEVAKQHCRECADCAGFVRALTLVKRAPLPEPPAGLADRVMTAVRSEAAAEKARAETAAALTAKAGASVEAGSGSPSSAVDAAGDQHAAAEGTDAALLPLNPRRARPAVLAAWVGVAAVLLAGIGVVGIMGVRLIAQGETPTSSKMVIGPASVPSDAGAVIEAAPPVADTATGSASSSVAVSSGPDYVVFKEIAYRLVGPATVEKSQLMLLGTTTTSLNGGAMRSRDVRGAAGIPGVYVEDDGGGLLELQPLERQFEGRAYQLRSADLPAFGIWPSLPAGITPPTSPDGSPTFSAAGADPSGVTIYRRTTSTVAEGIAVAPGAPSGDPASGNPNWTWWTPAAP